jgi:hypothetical protein
MKTEYFSFSSGVASSESMASLLQFEVLSKTVDGASKENPAEMNTAIMGFEIALKV